MRNPPLAFRSRSVDATRSYVAQRGSEHATADWFGVGFFAWSGLMAERIVIPIHHAAGRC